MKNYILSIVVIFPFFLYAQNNGHVAGLNIIGDLTSTTKTDILFGKSNSELEGSVYVFKKEWEDGVIISKEDEKSHYPANYNAYTNEVEIMYNGKRSSLKHDIVKNITIDTKVFVPIEIANKNIFVEELAKGNVFLVKKYEAYLKKALPKSGMETSAPKDKIKIRESFLVKKPGEGNQFSSIKLKKKVILNVLNKDMSIISFVKKNKLSYSKEKDVIKIFQFYNAQK